MKLNEAIERIKGGGRYRVSFEWDRGHLRTSDHFPADSEPPLAKEEAWALAEGFAKATPDAINVRLVDAATYAPLDERVLNQP